MAEVRLVLKGYEPIREGAAGKARRYRNTETGETIGVGTFQRRAKRVVVIPKAPKPRETIQQKRGRWMRNHLNHQVYLRQGAQDEYFSTAEAIDSVDFQAYQSLIRSRSAADREAGYEFFRELEEEYETVEWGDT